MYWTDLSDSELRERLLHRLMDDPFVKPLINVQIQGFREGEPEAIEWIDRILN